MTADLSFAPTKEDFTALHDSALADRWEGLPESVSELIHPIRSASADRFRNTASSLDKILGSEVIEFSSNTSTDAFRAHLHSLGIPPATDVMVWWPWGAAFAPWHVVVDYWDDFCYAGADDLTIWPTDGSWALAYDHHERFRFKRLSA